MKKLGESSGFKFLFAALFGTTFGFLLQRGGMGKFEVLLGQLLLTDFAVAKVMLTAIIVGMIGVYTLHSMGKVELHVKPTRLAANGFGGLLFGVGFALIGYCPGSAAAALGEGHWDALFGMSGLIAGSYLYAEFSKSLSETVESWGNLGKLTLPQVLKIERTRFIVGFSTLLLMLLAVIEWFYPGP